MLYNELEQGDILSGVRVGLALLAYTDILLCSIWAMHRIRQTPVINILDLSPSLIERFCDMNARVYGVINVMVTLYHSGRMLGCIFFGVHISSGLLIRGMYL